MEEALVTGTLFITPEDERWLQRRNLQVARLALAAATEDELVEAIPGKAGYLLGGDETVTERVIDAADTLRAIVLCGSDLNHFVPAHEHARKRDIKVENIPFGHGQAVAEWMLGQAIYMNRAYPDKDSSTAVGLEGQSVAIVGFGHVGMPLVGMLRTFHPKKLWYLNPTRYVLAERMDKLWYEPSMDELLPKADVVFLCMSSSVGPGFFGARQFEAMKKNALLVSCLPPGIVDEPALLEALQSGTVRAVSDYPMGDPAFDDLPPERWQHGTGNAFNTVAGLAATGSAAAHRLFELLGRGRL